MPAQAVELLLYQVGVRVELRRLPRPGGRVSGAGLQLLDRGGFDGPVVASASPGHLRVAHGDVELAPLFLEFDHFVDVLSIQCGDLLAEIMPNGGRPTFSTDLFLQNYCDLYTMRHMWAAFPTSMPANALTSIFKAPFLPSAPRSCVQRSSRKNSWTGGAAMFFIPFSSDSAPPFGGIGLP